MSKLRQIAQVLESKILRPDDVLFDKWYFVGGCVRDSMLGRPFKDVDIVVEAVTNEEVAAFNYGMIDLWVEKGTYAFTDDVEVKNVGKSFNVFLLKIPELYTPIEIALTRKERSMGFHHTEFEVEFGATIEEDSRRRDFTVNAMYLRLGDVPAGDEEYTFDNLIDFHDGEWDLQHLPPIVHTVGSAQDCFLEDPLRMLRAFSLAAKLKVDCIGDEEEWAISNMADLIETVSAERVRDELVKIIMSPAAHKLIGSMQRCGLLKYIIPELDACVGVWQNPEYHRYSVFRHTMWCLEYSPLDLNVRLAVLLHDVGKPPCKSIGEDGKSHFYRHELESTILTSDRLKALRFPNETVDYVTMLVSMHGYNEEGLSGASNNKVLKFCNAIQCLSPKEVDTHPLFLLRFADRRGKGFSTPKESDNVHQAKLQVRMRNVLAADRVVKITDLAVGGDDVMGLLGIPPGPRVGDMLKYLHTLVVEHPEYNDKESLIQIIMHRNFSGLVLEVNND